MTHFVVSMRGGEQATVEAGNWLTALGLGLDRLGAVEGLDRLACEVLANGTVIARDARTGSGFVVQPQPDPLASPLLPASAPAEDSTTLRQPAEAEDQTVLIQSPFVVEDQTVLIRSPFPADDPTLLLQAPAEALDEDTEVFALESDTASVQVVAPEQPFDPDGLDDALLQPLLGAVRDAPMESMAWQVALEIAQELVPCEAGSVLRMEADGGLRFMSATGPEAHKLAGVTLPPGKGIVGFCATRRMGLIVNNPARDRRFYREMDEATGFATRSLLCVPIHAGGRTAGCLELLNPPEGAPFSKVHLDRIEPVARALGLRLAALA